MYRSIQDLNWPSGWSPKGVVYCSAVKRTVSSNVSLGRHPSCSAALVLSKVSSAEDGWRMIGNVKGKHAVTRWRLIASRNGRSLIACFPETGRTHQIRAHLSEGLGLGILGDPVYGVPSIETGAPMLLHARSLTIPRGSKTPVSAIAPLPDRFAAAGFSEQDLTDAGL